jgi:hypothetical protein
MRGVIIINGGNWPARIRSALPQSPDINDARRQFLVRADIVAKLGEGHSARNNRIKTGEFLNQRCVLRPYFELMLRAQRPKIVLQQYRHTAGQSIGDRLSAAGES